ncbi:MAG TPA: YceI family protein [Steroidobacteraceae bacterium]|nr:YceI family protein [Steroidobacteraceae bacterium]
MRPATLLAAFALSAPALGLADEIPSPSTAAVPAGQYTVDKAHTSLIFRVSHLGFSTYTGRFTDVDAKLDFDPRNLAASRVEVSIDPRSIQADNAPSGFLQTLAGDAWLDADRFPEMTFRTKAVEVTGPKTFRIRGELTLHGVTRPVVLDARYNGGYASHPYEPNARVGFSATGTFKRSDFGVSYGIPAPGTTMGVSDEVKVLLESEFTGPPAKVASR